jgi:hypothetical protein
MDFDYMMHKPLSMFAFLGTIVLSVGCQPDPPKATLSNIVGDWEVITAKRNNRITSLLNGTYFAFTSAQQVRTNLPVYETTDEWVSDFSFQHDTLIQFGTPPIKYILKNWSDSTLELTFTTRGIPFYLNLGRAKGAVGVSRDTIIEE